MRIRGVDQDVFGYLLYIHKRRKVKSIRRKALATRQKLEAETFKGSLPERFLHLEKTIPGLRGRLTRWKRP